MVDLTNPFTLWVWGLSHCQTHLTDGIIVTDVIPKKALKAAAELVRRRLWEVHDLGWKVHDYLVWNDCRDLVVDRQAKARERKEAWLLKQREERARTRSERAKNASGTAWGTDNLTKPNLTKPIEREGREGRTPPLQLGLKRFKVWRWMLDQFIDQLGPHADAFDLEGWLLALDKRDTAVITDGWAFLQAAFAAEVELRGLAAPIGGEDARLHALLAKGPSVRP